MGWLGDYLFPQPSGQYALNQPAAGQQGAAPEDDLEADAKYVGDMRAKVAAGQDWGNVSDQDQLKFLIAKRALAAKDHPAYRNPRLPAETQYQSLRHIAPLLPPAVGKEFLARGLNSANKDTLNEAPSPQSARQTLWDTMKSYDAIPDEHGGIPIYQQRYSPDPLIPTEDANQLARRVERNMDANGNYIGNYRDPKNDPVYTHGRPRPQAPLSEEDRQYAHLKKILDLGSDPRYRSRSSSETDNGSSSSIGKVDVAGLMNATNAAGGNQLEQLQEGVKNALAMSQQYPDDPRWQKMAAAKSEQLRIAMGGAPESAPPTSLDNIAATQAFSEEMAPTFKERASGFLNAAAAIMPGPSPFGDDPELAIERNKLSRLSERFQKLPPAEQSELAKLLNAHATATEKGGELTNPAMARALSGGRNSAQLAPLIEALLLQQR